MRRIVFDIPALDAKRKELEIISSQPEFWADQNKARKLMRKLDDIKDQLSQINKWNQFILDKTKLTPVFNKISKGSNPLIFPAYSKNKEESKYWFDWGWSQGVDIKSWPTLPEELINKNNSLNKWEKILCFPLDLSIKKKILNITSKF